MKQNYLKRTYEIIINIKNNTMIIVLILDICFFNLDIF